MPCLGYRENVSPSVYGYLASHYAMREGSEMLKHSAWFRYVAQLVQDPRVPDTKYHWYQDSLGWHIRTLTASLLARLVPFFSDPDS